MLLEGFLRGLAVGILISVLNPALLSSWILFSGTALLGLGYDGSVAASVGAFLGTFGWFAGLALGATRFRAHPVLRSAWVPRVLGLLLAGYGAFLVASPLAAALGFGRA